MKPIPDFPGYYANDGGEIFRCTKSGKFRLLKPYYNCKHLGKPYMAVSLWRNKKRYTKLVHHLVLEAFVSKKPSSLHVTCHLNDIGNDNRLSNLIWGLPHDNGKNRKQNLITFNETIKKAISIGMTIKELSIISNISEAILMEHFK